MSRYVLFVADFDERESNTYYYDTLDELIADQDGSCEECDGIKKWMQSLINNGSYSGEWHNYHLIDKQD